MEYRVDIKDHKLTKREQLLVLEIDTDTIDTASSFVDYIEETYGFSKSSIWYCLNRLKESGMVEFANKDHHGMPLMLTKHGMEELHKLEGIRNELVTQYSNMFLSKMQVMDRNYAYSRLG